MAKNNLLEIRKEINSHKDEIKNSAQKILSALDNSTDKSFIDVELLEILNALAKIGTISGDSKNIAIFIKDQLDLLKDLKQFGAGKQEDIRLAYQWWLNQICSASFNVKQKGRKYEITIPIKINISIFKSLF